MATTAMATPIDLLDTLTTAPHAFLQPPTKLHASSLSFLKQTLDPIASSIAQVQQQRLQEARKKRKRGQDYADEEVLRLKKVHVDGFAIEQVWEQARRVIDAARQEAERGLDELIASAVSEDGSDEEDLGETMDSGMLDGEEDDIELGEEGVDYEVVGEDVDGEDMDDLSEEDDVDGEDIEMDEDGMEDEDLEDEGPAEEYVPDPHGLNDGFFSIDDFNRQSEFLEQADARGENDETADDEEDVDWNADPAAAGPIAGEGEAEDEEDEDEDEEDGPTFGNVGLNAPEGASDDEDMEIEEGEMDDMGGLGNTNNIKYADFFAPPAQKARKNKKGRPNPHNFPTAQNPPASSNPNKEIEEDMKRTMSAVHRDLFEESEPEEEEAADDENLDPGDPRSRRSTHERRRAALAEEIRKLEAANVAKREWTLQGEARAADRPMNSLLEEDLEFERAGKPVPVITAEVSESIEELIKRRIIAHDFNDIIRRRPDDLATGGRRGKLDYSLDETKSKKSLAELYEEEHLKRTDPNYVDAQDEKSIKEQKEIEALWKDIVGKLDSLSNWHYKPATPSVGLDIRVDAPVVRLEDARPAAGADAAGASQLAPQEVYRAGEAVERGEEVATRGGGVVAREELSREEKKRRRRREKERGKKAGTNESTKKESGKTKERKGIVEDLKRGGVKVIGKKGELRDVEGNAVRGDAAPLGAGSFKL